MSAGGSDGKWFYLRVMLAVFGIIAFAVLGSLLGRYSAERRLEGVLPAVPETSNVEESVPSTKPPVVNAPDNLGDEPLDTEGAPVYLVIRLGENKSLADAGDIISHAMGIGVDSFVIPVETPWSSEIAASVADELNELTRGAPDAEFTLSLDLGVPDDWRERFPEDMNDGQVYPSPASKQWRDECGEALTRLAGVVNDVDAVKGVLLRALGHGTWAWTEDMPLNGKDMSESEAAEYRLVNTVGAITDLANHMRQLTNSTFEIIVPYGYLCQVGPEYENHQGLSQVLGSEVSGIWGLPEAPFNGPVDAPGIRDKRWFIVDETLTNDTALDEVVAAQRKQFAIALTHELPYACVIGVDNQPIKEDTWKRIGAFADIYARTMALDVAYEPTLSLVLPEYGLPASLKHASVEALTQSGVGTRAYLFEDLVSGRVPASHVYVIFGHTSIEEPLRDSLQARFSELQAVSVWVQDDQEAAVEDLSATVNMKVGLLASPSGSGSKNVVDSALFAEGEIFGADIEGRYVVDSEEASPLAEYVKPEGVSVAMMTAESGWTSVYVAMPTLPPSLLRQVLDIVELPSIVEPLSADGDEAFVGPGLLALVAGDAGERTLRLGTPHDVNDLYDPSSGWPSKRQVILPMKAGEVRLLRVLPPVE